MSTIHVKNIQIYIDRDKDGYVSLSTDGWKEGILDPIISALRALQTDDDREADEVSSEHDAWVRSGLRGVR